ESQLIHWIQFVLGRTLTECSRRLTKVSSFSALCTRRRALTFAPCTSKAGALSASTAMAGDTETTPIISVIASIQPNVVASIVSSVLKDGGQDDGMLERFQFSVEPDDDVDWAPSNVEVTPELEAAVNDIFRAMDSFAVIRDTIGKMNMVALGRIV